MDISRKKSKWYRIRKEALERKGKELCNGRMMIDTEQLISFDYIIFIVHPDS